MTSTWNIKIKGNTSISVPADIHSMTTYVLLEQEDWFEDETELVRRIAKPGMSCLDIGACYGVYALLMSSALGPEDTVYAFEPGQVARDYLLPDKPENLEVITKALSDKPGRASLSQEPPELCKTTQGQDFEQITLDDWWQEAGQPGIDLLKLDVNGQEPQVIRGGKEFLTQSSPVIIFSKAQAEASIAELTSLGYETYRYLPGQGVLEPFSESRQDQYLLNLIAARPETVSELGLLQAELSEGPADWESCLGQLPWTGEFFPIWQDKGRDPANADYIRGLNLLCAGRAREAAQELTELFQQNPQVPIALTLSRAFYEIGNRRRAVQILQHLSQSALQGRQLSFHLPFLPPLPGFDHLQVKESAQDWPLARCMEAFVYLKSFSGYFSGDKDLQMLKAIHKNPERLIESERCLALCGMRTGKKITIQPTSRLLTDEHLNAQVWGEIGGVGPSGPAAELKISQTLIQKTQIHTEINDLSVKDSSTLESFSDLTWKHMDTSILYSVHASLDYMRPPLFSKKQIFCGPSCKTRKDSNGHYKSLQTPVGQYDVSQIISQLPDDQKPIIFLAHVDATMRNLPFNLDKLKCKKIMLIGDTHHMHKPLEHIGRYVLTNQFDYYFADCKKQHLHFFYESDNKKKFHFFPGIRNRIEADKFNENRPLQVSFVGQQGKFHPYRKKLLKSVTQKGLPLQVQGASQEKAFHIYANSLISLNISLNTEMNMRFFEVIAAGGFILTDRLSTYTGYDLVFKEGRDFVFYDGPEDLCEKIDYYLKNPDKALEIARNGFETYHKHWNIHKRRQMFFDLVMEDKVHPVLAAFKDERFPAGQAEDREFLAERIRQYEFIQELHRFGPLEVYLTTSVPEKHRLDILDLMRLNIITENWQANADKPKKMSRVLMISDDELLAKGLPEWYSRDKFDYVLFTRNPEQVGNPVNTKDCSEILRSKGLVLANKDYPEAFKLSVPQDQTSNTAIVIKNSASNTTNKSDSNDKIKALQNKFNLSYHIPYLFRGEQEVGLSDQKVLEIGGSLPKELVIDELGASQWISIEDFSYWRELPEDGGGTRPQNLPEQRVKDISGNLPTYQVLDGQIEELPECPNNTFDRIFSIACFEHIHTLGHALEKMYTALKPGGLLFTMFSPIWSAHNGHHLPKIQDAAGQTFSHGQSPIPPWRHLLLSPPEMEKYLSGKTDHETVAKLIYHIYHSPHINRLFTEDYISYFKQSSFAVLKAVPTFPSNIPEQTLNVLRRKYPGRQHFANNGLLVVLKKDDSLRESLRPEISTEHIEKNKISEQKKNVGINTQKQSIFIGGFARSGTTLIQGLICNSKYTIQSTSECYYLLNLLSAYEHAKRIFNIHTHDYFKDFHDLRRFHSTLIDSYITKVRENFGEGVIVQKQPGIYQYFQEIHDFFSEPCLIFMVRDLRDVAASQLKRQKRKGYNFNALAWLNQEMKKFIHIFPRLSKHSDQIMFVRYEYLCMHPDQTMSNLSTFVGLPDLEQVSKQTWKHKRDKKCVESWSPLDGKPPTGSSIGSFQNVFNSSQIDKINAITLQRNLEGVDKNSGPRLGCSF